jgi:outer membrane immunogenic protein
MKIKALALAATIAAGMLATPAMAQDNEVGENGTSFRGIRVEGNIGVDRFRSQGVHNDELGVGATIGFDGTIGSRFVVGAEGNFWRGADWNENCSLTGGGNTTCHKAFEEWGAAIRAGYLVTPDLLIFGKAGYVNGEQRRRVNGPTGTQLVYDHYRADGHQLGAGVEYTFTHGRLPIYVNAQYVYSDYHGNTSRQKLMTGIGIRFK